MDPFIAVENPSRSYFWSMPSVLRLLEQEGMFKVEFQSCAHGGERPKWTTIATNCQQLAALALCCPGDHEHKPLGYSAAQGFATAAEAEAFSPLLQNREHYAGCGNKS